MTETMEKPTTTTMSLIGVRAGQHTIVIAMLKSLGYVELRIDEMRPRLLDFGSNAAETKQLLDAHRDLIARLRSKQDQVEQLLAGADKLVTEQKTDDGIVVYEAMAESLGIAWRELNRQLDLRGYILEDALNFYLEADNHAEIVHQISGLLRSALSGNQQAVGEAQNAFNRLLDVTSSAVDLGSSIIAQICVLGNLADNAERPSETANACLLIEKVMLKLAQEWESVESVWNQEKERLGLGAGAPQQQPQRDALSEQLTEIENWLRNAQAQVAHGADAAILSGLIQEAQHQSEVLRHLLTQFQSQRNDASIVKCRELQNSMDTFIRQIQERNQLGSRIQQFLQNADSMLHQLDKMEVDLSNASAAIAGELGPLARQKARKVIDEGSQIMRIEQNEEVASKLSQLQTRLQQIEELAKHRIQVGSQLLKSQISNLTTWLRDTAEPFLASNGNLGNDYNSATEFVTRHKQFATEVINKEHEVNTVLNRAHELNTEDRRHLTDFEHRYESLKQTLENRIQLGNNFQQVQKFSRELDSSFETLSNLLDANRDFSNENVVQQMNNVFHMIQETFQQERHQGEKFVSNAKFLASHDVHLNADHAIDSVRQIITNHEQKIQQMTEKWQTWERVKHETKAAVHIIEEIQMWQVDVFEIIRNLEIAADRATNEEEKEQVRERIEQVIRQMPQQQQKLQEAHRLVTEKGSEDSHLRIQKAAQTQADIEKRLKQIQTKLTTTQTSETFIEEGSKQVHQKAPRLVTELRDAQIDEGSRFQFAARIESEAEPKITWTKDEMDVKTNVDYRQSFLNGVATLTIEETFIEDSATYKIRVENPHGTAESSARLTVKSKSQLGTPDVQKPRFVKQLQNVNVVEGETARIDCVVMAQPEPKVTWFKEEETIQESERIKLGFQGDHCSLTINKTTPSDSGLYKASARNQAGETTNFCRIYVQPATPTRKAPPPTPPKPKTPIHEAPAFAPSLVNQTVEEGQKTLFQVRTTGAPPPKVTWKFKEQPIKSTENVKIEEEETGWSRLILNNVGPQHTGLYTVEAINESGEARSGATLIVTTPGQSSQGGVQQRSMTMIQSEGFWSDGAYTGGTPTPPPVPQHRHIQTTMIEEYQQQDVGELGYSSIANAPDFVRPFQKEYTVNEGEKIQIDCLMVGNPRPKVYWYFNDKPIKSNYQVAEFLNVGDTYSIVFTPAKLENAGFYKMVAENIKGKTESSTVIHVRPRSLIPQPKASRKPHIIEHQKIIETFGATDYSEIIPQKRSGLSTPPPAKRPHGLNQQSLSQSYHSGQQRGFGQQQVEEEFMDRTITTQQKTGTPPHFSQTLVSQVTTVGEPAKFDGVVTGTPAPEIQWSKDGVAITKQSHPHIDFSNIGGRISLVFRFTSPADSGKYMCSAMSSGGIATSSAQLVVRPKTVAPDFVKRLISEEVMEGDRLHWTIKVSGDPLPKVTWLRDGQVIPHCDEVQILDEGHGIHSLMIPHVQLVDGGQFTAVAVNPGGEARSSADLVVRPRGAEPGTFFHITKVTQERQVKGEEVSRDQTFSIENPRATPTK